MTRFNDIPAPIAALFDLDGVLIDSETRYTEFWHQIGLRYAIGHADFALRIKGTTLNDILGTYFAPELHKDIVKALNAYESSMPYDIKPGVIELLKGLRSRGIPAVMVTSSNDIKMSRLWKQHPDFRYYFKDIVTADKITSSKPDPESYLLGARLAGAPAGRCCVFEDSRQGVIAGHNAGAFVVGITGTLSAEALADKADLVIDSLENFDIDKLTDILLNRPL